MGPPYLKNKYLHDIIIHAARTKKQKAREAYVFHPEIQLSIKKKKSLPTHFRKNDRLRVNLVSRKRDPQMWNRNVVSIEHPVRVWDKAKVHEQSRP